MLSTQITQSSNDYSITNCKYPNHLNLKQSREDKKVESYTTIFYSPQILIFV